jgi:hypothetical protein
MKKDRAKCICLISILLALLAVGCKEEGGSTMYVSSDSITDTVYVALNKHLVYAIGKYAFFTGAIDVRKYSQIRVNTSEFGSGTTSVSLIMTDTNMTDYGVLDYYILDSNISNGSSVTRVYDVPGLYVRVAFLSDDSTRRVDLAIFGR